MKKRIQFICALSVFALLLSSCANNGGQGNDTTDNSETAEQTEIVLADPVFLVKADGTANCTVTVPRKSSDEVKKLVENFIKDVKKKTGAELPVNDEYSAIETDYEIVINSDAGREPVAEQMKETGYTDYRIGIWDWHIMLTSRSDAATKAGLKKICNLLEKTDDGYCLREDINVLGSALLGDKKASVPVYDTESGEELPYYPIDGGYEVCIQKTNESECLAYAEKLSKNGFTRYSENAMSAGSDTKAKNLTFVYTAEDVHVFLNYNSYQKTTRIVFTNAEALPSLKKPELTAADNAEMSLAQLGIAGLGMSYVIQLKDYSFIVLDGGTSAQSNVNMLYEYLVSKTPTGQKPRIACWVFTHGDPDHIGAPKAFLNAHMENVDVDSVVYNFPDCSVQDTSQDDAAMGTSIFTLKNTIKSFYDATIYTVHTGQKLYFKGVEMEIIFTEEDLYPAKANSYNDTCIMARFTFDNGKVFTMLGDSTVQTSKQLAATYKDYLKSDMLQLAHHGLIGGDKALYQYIDPDICFWATAKERYEGKWDTNKDGTVNLSDVQHCLGQGGCDYNAYIRDTTIKARTHYHAGQTTVIKIK